MRVRALLRQNQLPRRPIACVIPAGLLLFCLLQEGFSRGFFHSSQGTLFSAKLSVCCCLKRVCHPRSCCLLAPVTALRGAFAFPEGGNLPCVVGYVPAFKHLNKILFCRIIAMANNKLNGVLLDCSYRRSEKHT